MVRNGSNETGRTLERVQAVHGSVRALDSASVGEVSSVAETARICGWAQEVAVEGDDDLSLCEIVNRVDWLAKGESRALVGIGSASGLVAVPLGTWILR